jgi:hypothetical protein
MSSDFALTTPLTERWSSGAFEAPPPLAAAATGGYSSIVYPTSMGTEETGQLAYRGSGASRDARRTARTRVLLQHP